MPQCFASVDRVYLEHVNIYNTPVCQLVLAFLFFKKMKGISWAFVDFAGGPDLVSKLLLV